MSNHSTPSKQSRGEHLAEAAPPLPDEEAISQDDLFNIMISTDNHLGFKENDKVRSNDSFLGFQEVLSM